MTVNGVDIVVIGRQYSYEEIGKLLTKASFEEMGTGLTVVFTEEEERIIRRDHGGVVGRAISNLIWREVNGVGLKPNFKYTYVNRTFQTSVAE